MKLCFVLVRPARPENVGAAARALKTMGYDDLRVVGSDAHRQDEAAWVAHGARELLAGQSFDSLEAALADCDLAVATTARARGDQIPCHSPEQLRGRLADLAQVAERTAIVFGCEESGLSNAELAQCQLRSYIPLAQPQPSLNLAQAVMLYAYALSVDSRDASLTPPAEAARGGELAAARQQLGLLLEQAGVDTDETPAQWAIQQLNQAGSRDLRLFLFLANKLLKPPA
ncbi:tRNA/rRNA methyltransferase [Gallaecimonas sp. GXIMD4217]|uniref:tRNA/rRNA methyltransferase n=1 Tax=Gallaecimonas sp. GXIMD4217 TaxID=3131927 RepID=UPI00311AF462